MTVQELFAKLLHRLPHFEATISFVEAVQAVQTVITRRLWTVKGDLLRETWESSEQAIGVTVVDLPLGMLGIGGSNDDLPYIVYDTEGSTTSLSAVLLPKTEHRAHLTVGQSEGIPREYDMRAFAIELFPVSEVAYTLFVPMYRSPPNITKMTDILPWNGFYDHLFQDAVLHMIGPAGLAAFVSPTLEQAIMRAVDENAVMRTGRRVFHLFA